MDEKPSLKVMLPDKSVSGVNATVGAIPVVGPFFAELINYHIPQQRLDRVVTFLEMLNEQYVDLAAEIDAIKENLSRLNILEESIVQASRAVSDDRLKYLAELVAKGMSQEKLSHDNARYILRLLRDLTDSEIHLLASAAKTSESNDTRIEGKYKSAYISHLRSLNLLESVFQVNEDGLSVFNSEPGELIITELGLLLLDQIGFDVGDTYNDPHLSDD